jgi:prepilin-type N-terminal cleavage/methylation domain-containing protein
MQGLNTKAFTLVELIVVITILAILGTIGFISLLWYQSMSRDAVRISDIKNIAKAIDLYSLEHSSFPKVHNGFNITHEGNTLWTQGTFGSSSFIDTRIISEIPLDPLSGKEYSYARTARTREYEIAWIFEKNQSITLIPQSYANLPDNYQLGVRGNYNGKFIVHRDEDIISVFGIPSLISSYTGWTVEYQDILDQKLLAYRWSSALPYNYLNETDSPINTPWDFNPPSALIYQWPMHEAAWNAGRSQIYQNIMNYYAFSDVADTSSFREFSRWEEIISDYIRANTGGFWVIVPQATLCNTNFSNLDFSWWSGGIGSVTANTITWASTEGWKLSYSAESFELPIHLEFTRGNTDRQSYMFGLMPANITPTHFGDDSAYKFYISYTNPSVGFEVYWKFPSPWDQYSRNINTLPLDTKYEIDISETGQMTARIWGEVVYETTAPITQYKIIYNNYLYSVGGYKSSYVTGIALTDKNSPISLSCD